MGASGPSTGGGGGVGAAGKKKSGSYGTKKDAKKASSRNELRSFIRGGGVVGAVIRGITKSGAKSKAKKQANVEIGLGTDRMSNYTVGQGGTKEKEGNDNNNQPTQPTQLPKPIIVKKNIGGRDVQVQAPTEAEMAQAEADKKEEYDVRKTKRRGRRMTILTPTGGVRGNFVLGKPTLLGS